MKIDINELTLGQIKEILTIAETLNLKTDDSKKHGAIGSFCIIRTYASGVHFGKVVSIQTNEGRSRCEVHNARRLYFWKTRKGLSLSDLAVNGMNIESSKICETVPIMFIEDCIEFIPIKHEHAVEIENAKTYHVG